MRVTVVGAGNMGLAMTAYMVIHQKADVTLYTTKKIELLRLKNIERGTDEKVPNFIVTNNPVQAFTNADIIFVTYPAFLRGSFINANQDYIRTGAFLGFVPGYGGAEYCCERLINRGVCVFGLQRVPYVARTSQRALETVACILSEKKELFVCSIPKEKTEELAKVINKLIDIPVNGLNEYLSITLAPSNPLLHITGLYNVFKHYETRERFKSPMRFYEQWNDEASKMLFDYDAELQEICKKMTPIDMKEVVPLPVYYESTNPRELTRKLQSIEAFKSVMVPLQEEKDGFVPDLSSRMFIEDYPFGVCIIKDFAIMLNVKTPTIDLLLDFYRKISGHKYFNADGSYTKEIDRTGVPGIHNLKSKEEIIAFYHR